MKRTRFSLTAKLYEQSLYALLAAVVTTFVLLLIGLDKLGEGVIALLYMVPVVWSAARWGQGPGIAAALASGLLFDFFFTTPYYTFVVSKLEDWLILVIFLAVAIVVVSRIQTSLSKAQKSEHEAVFMYELSTMLAAARTQDAVAHGVARFLKERYLTSAVTVSIHPKGQPVETVASEPREAELTTRPDRILGLLNAWGMIGEINIWQGQIELPAEDSRLFRNFAAQTGQAIERTLLYEAEAYKNAAFRSN